MHCLVIECVTEFAVIYKVSITGEKTKNCLRMKMSD